MAESQKHAERHPSDAAEDVNDGQPSQELKERVEKLSDETDSVLDEIDDVLEENAEEFVRSYIQKGGQ